MYNFKIISNTCIKCNDSTASESLEEKLRKVIEMKEPIDDTAPLIYTEKKEGVHAAYDIRTDRFEIAIDANDRIQGALVARREEQERQKKETESKTDTKTE